MLEKTEEGRRGGYGQGMGGGEADDCRYSRKRESAQRIKLWESFNIQAEGDQQRIKYGGRMGWWAPISYCPSCLESGGKLVR